MANPTEKVNNNSNFVKKKGKTHCEEEIFSPSVAAEEGSLCYPDPSNPGQWTIADATAGNAMGVLRQTIATTDDDYASTKRVMIEKPLTNDVKWRFTVGSGTFTSADTGKYADLVDATTVAVDTQSKKVVYITDYISATKGLCILAGNVSAGLAMPATS